MTTQAAPTLAAQVGRQLAHARGTKSIREFAREAGLASATVHQLEQGRDNPTLNRLEKMAAAYGLRVTITLEPA